MATATLGGETDFDGWRTTALYAMTDDDWPAAKVGLLDRLSRNS